jgi:RinA family phage transcriptional activator
VPKLTRKDKYRQAMLRALDWEVRTYHETRALLEELRQDVIEAGHVSDGTGRRAGGTTSDTTGQRAMLLTSYQIAEMGRRVAAVERAIEEWTARDRSTRETYIRLRFWDNQLTNEGIAMRIGVDAATIYRWRNDFLGLVASYLGWRL